MKHFLKIIIFLIITNFSLSQTKVGKVEFVLGIFPEYDNENVLTMLQFNIPDSLLPYKAVIDVPKNITSFFELDTSNSLVEKELQNLGKLKVRTSNPQYYCQFYFDLERNNTERKINYQLKLDRDLNNFHVLVQQPLGMSEFSHTLENAEVFNDEYNLTYHRSLIENLEKNKSLNISINYFKNSDITTLEILEKILMDHSHGNEQDGFRHEHEHVSNNEIHEKFDKSKYYGFLFGLPLILIFIGIYNYSKKSNLNSIDNKLIRFCSHCSKQYEIKNKQKFCKNCGSEIDVS